MPVFEKQEATRGSWRSQQPEAAFEEKNGHDLLEGLATGAPTRHAELTQRAEAHKVRASSPTVSLRQTLGSLGGLDARRDRGLVGRWQLAVGSRELTLADGVVPNAVDAARAGAAEPPEMTETPRRRPQARLSNCQLPTSLMELGCQIAARIAEAYVAASGHFGRSRFFHRRCDRKTKGHGSRCRSVAGEGGTDRAVGHEIVAASSLSTRGPTCIESRI